MKTTVELKRERQAQHDLLAGLISELDELYKKLSNIDSYVARSKHVVKIREKQREIKKAKREGERLDSKIAQAELAEKFKP